LDVFFFSSSRFLLVGLVIVGILEEILVDLGLC
jgi:hypothetical protein